jgi:hypothetical protein
VAGRRERRCKRLLEHLKAKTGYWTLKAEAVDPTLQGLALEEAMDLS